MKEVMVDRQVSWTQTVAEEDTGCVCGPLSSSAVYFCFFRSQISSFSVNAELNEARGFLGTPALLVSACLSVPVSLMMAGFGPAP